MKKDLHPVFLEDKLHGIELIEKEASLLLEDIK